MNHEEMTLKLKNTPLPDTEILSAEFVDGGNIRSDELGYDVAELPPLYRVRLIHHPGSRSNIRTEVWLPEAGNGRLVGTGNGGMGGALHLGSMGGFVRQGYACAHTDLGTSGGVLCGWENDDVKADYGWRATHWMTVCAKELFHACCGKAPAYSYFSGSSTGGLQAYSEAQRYPGDYDGIYAGVPSIVNTAYHTDYLWNYVHLHTADRKPMFTHGELVRLTGLAGAYAQELGDGEPGDAFVTTPYRGEGTVDGFLEYLEKNAPELTLEQREALRAVYTGPTDSRNGRPICCGLPIGGEMGMESFCGNGCPGIYPFLWAFGETFDPWSFDFAADFDEFDRRMGRYINAIDPDLRAFRDRGGRLLAFSGTADTVVLYPETDLYYERAAERMGGAEECSRFFRYFLLPGRAHGGGIGADRISSSGKNGWDAFDALVIWVEKGIAPDVLEAVSSDDSGGGTGKKSFVRPIYPYGSEAFPFREHPKTYSDRLIRE